MKRAGNLWTKVFDEDKAVIAIIQAVKFKKHNKKVQELLLYSDEHVKKFPNDYHQVDIKKARIYARYLLNKLRTKTWKHKFPVHKLHFCKNNTKKKGKWRNLYIPSLEDHCIAHIVMQIVEPIILKSMHPNCCGSVPERGIKKVNKQIKNWIRHDSRNCRYFVKLDIKKFFDSISKDILKNCLRRHIKDKNILWVLDQFIDSSPSACPVGYYTSPWFGNLLLQDLDYYIEQELYKIRRDKVIKHIKHYVRYMDDMLLISSSKSDLYKSVKAVKKYIKKYYNLEIKNSWEIKELGNKNSHKYGIDICGYKFYKDCTILRDGIFLSTYKLARRIYKKKYVTIHEALSIISKIGWSKFSNNTNFLNLYIRPYVNINKLRRFISKCGKSRKIAII